MIGMNVLLGNTYCAGGTHKENNIPGLPFFGQHDVTSPRDTDTCCGSVMDSNHNGKYDAGVDPVLAMDLNHDGRITRSDLQGSRDRLRAMGGNFDLNRDGKTTLSERIRGRAYQKEMQGKDLNQDGRLDAFELDQAGGRVLIDRNRDGQLTPNESFSPFNYPTGGFGTGHFNYFDPFAGKNGESSTTRTYPSPWSYNPMASASNGYPAGAGGYGAGYSAGYAAASGAGGYGGYPAAGGYGSYSGYPAAGGYGAYGANPYASAAASMAIASESMTLAATSMAITATAAQAGISYPGYGAY